MQNDDPSIAANKSLQPDLQNHEGDDFALTDYIPAAPYGKSAGAIHRALEILELFSVEQRPLTVGEVCEKLQYPQSSTSVLLRSLADLGYLEHDRRARIFQPTLRIVFLGMWMHHRMLNQSSVLEFMETLAHASSGHVAALGIQNGIYAQYIHIVAGRSSRVGLKPGLLRPICRSATGKVLLSTKPDEEVRRIVRNVNALDKQQATQIDVESLLVELNECRETKFAQSINGVTHGAATVATQLPIDFGGTPLAVGVSCHSSEFERMRPFMIKLIQDTISRYFPPTPKNTPGDRVRHLPLQAGYSIARHISDADEQE